MDVEAYLASPVHLGSLAFKFWDFNLGRSRGVGGWGVKPKIKLVLHKIVDVPAFSLPAEPIALRLYGEPIHVRLFILTDVADQGHEFLHTVRQSLVGEQ